MRARRPFGMVNLHRRILVSALGADLLGELVDVSAFLACLRARTLCRFGIDICLTWPKAHVGSPFSAELRVLRKTRGRI